MIASGFVGLGNHFSLIVYLLLHVLVKVFNSVQLPSACCDVFRFRVVYQLVLLY